MKPTRLAGRRALVVDGTAPDLPTLLGRAGMDVIVAATPEDALELLRLAPVDLVIVGAQAGWAVREIRASEATAGIAVVMVGSRDDADPALGIGAFVERPVRADRLRAAVHACLAPAP